MKWATREQREAARNALDELSSYRSPNGEEDDRFCDLNNAAADTQESLHPLQVFVLYQRWHSWLAMAFLAACIAYAIVKAVTGS